MKIQHKINKYLKIISMLVLTGMLMSGCGGVMPQSGNDSSVISESTISDSESNLSDDLQVHFIDVGQGSATLISSDNHYMLVDGGDRKYSSRVVSYLSDAGVRSLDYVIATHYDADHLNGVVGALNAFQTDNVISPDYQADSKVYQSYMKAVQTKRVHLIRPKTGDTYKLGKAKFVILAPNDTHYDDANDYSVAIKLTYGDNRFVMTGDAEIESEYEMLENGIPLDCDVYLAGHHGSKNSSSQAFLQAMRPKAVVISVGKDNSYGHPTKEALARFQSMKCKVYRTDKLGDIVATSDGHTITIHTQSGKDSGDITQSQNTKNENSYTQNSGKSQKKAYHFIGNVNSKKYHKDNCSSLPDEKNRVYFKSKKEAEQAGYTACKVCMQE